ncbi:MAG: hypothetical protein RID53_22375 [Coleofasciculus sp. B1-GNL1-01]|uniref:hypothetical protein n=1 Tax=Coleofasciculus sp. B1-GNL1-01 TaxID=3068484 RepID=UPI0032F2157F
MGNSEEKGRNAVGAGFTDNSLVQTHNLTKPALLVETGGTDIPSDNSTLGAGRV